MATFLFVIFIMTEIIFAFRQIRQKPVKKDWTLNRLIINASELGIFFFLLLMPGIDLSFRFKIFFILLVIRIAISGYIAFLSRHTDKPKKKSRMILGAFGNIVLFFISLIPAFIFADYTGRPLTGEYEVSQMQAILIDSSRVETFETDGSNREVPVHIYYPESVSETASLPLVIFSHGAFGYYQSNTSTYMELASNGYIVISLDHPYHSFFTKDSLGKTILVDRNFINDVMSVQGDTLPISEEELYALTSVWIKVRMDDMNFVIDTLKDAANEDFDDRWCFPAEDKEEIRSVLRLINTEKIGLMGHSLGGASSVSVGRRADIDAVIDLDGTMLGEEIGVENGMPICNDTPYTTPLLCIDTQSHHDELETLDNYVNSVILKGATCGFEVYIPGAKHMDFTDLPLFAPFLADMLGSGDIDNEKCIDQVNAYVLKFFNCYLKDEGSWK